MIAIKDLPPEPTEAELSGVQRSRFWGRWLCLYAALVGLVLAGSALPPVGHFYALWVLATMLFLFGLPVFLVGTIGAWRRATRLGSPLARSARHWWLAHWLLLAAGLLAADRGWTRPLGLALARPGLTRLAEQAQAATGDLVAIADRWVGLWPLGELRRYGSGDLRCSLLGTDSPAGKRGLFFTPGQPPSAGQGLAGTWAADSYVPLGQGWYGWQRAEPR